MIGRIRHWLVVKRYRLAVLIHALRDPMRAGDPALGDSREMRNRNILRMWDRWEAKGPKPEDYGLPADTAPSKEMERRQKEQRQ